MLYFVLQTLFLSLLAFFLGLILGRFLKKLFCKDRAYSERGEKYVTRTEGHDSSGKNVAKTAAALAVAGGVATVAKIATDDEVTDKAIEDHVDLSSNEIGSTESSLLAGEKQLDEVVELEVKDNATEIELDNETRVTEELKASSIDVEDNIEAEIQPSEVIEDVVTTDGELSKELTDQDDNSLLDIAKNTAAVAGAGVAAKLGADALNKDDLADEISEVEVSDVEEVVTEELDEVVSENIEIQDEITEEAKEITTANDEGTIEVGTESSEIIENDAVTVDDELTEELVEKNDGDDSSLLDLAKNTVAVAGAGVAAKLGTDALNKDDLADEISEVEVSDVGELAVELDEVVSENNADEPKTDATLEDSESGSFDIKTTVEETEVTVIDPVENQDARSGEEVTVDTSEDTDVTQENEENQISTEGDSEVSSDAEASMEDRATTSAAEENTDDHSLITTTAAMAGAGVAAKLAAETDNKDEVSSSSSAEESDSSGEEGAGASRKLSLIQEMLAMQAEFAEDERAGKFNAEDYYIGDGKEYRKRYHELAAEVREIASKEANFWK